MVLEGVKSVDGAIMLDGHHVGGEVNGRVEVKEERLAKHNFEVGHIENMKIA